MITSIITILFCLVPFIMFTQPALMIYGGENNVIIELLKKLGLDGQVSGYELIKFEEGQSVYLTVASVFMILTLVFAGLTMFSSIINFFLKDKSKSNGVSGKVVGMFYFLSAIVAGVMLALYADGLGISSEELKIIYTVGWGMLATLVSSLFALIFAPMGRKKKRK